MNASIASFWDVGWTVKLGDEINGYVACQNFENGTLHHAGVWLAQEACVHYPDSEFALLYKAALEGGVV